MALAEANWIEPAAPDALYERPLLVRVRHGDAPRPCRLGAAAGGNGAEPTLRFDHPLPGIASGQFAVLYGGDGGELCYGAGVMQRSELAHS